MDFSPSFKLSPEQLWLAKLSHPDTRISILLDGFPGFYRTDDCWNIRFAGLPVHLTHFIVDGSIRCQVRSEAFTLQAPAFICLAPNVPLHYASASRVLAMYRFRMKVTHGPEGLTCPRELLRFEQAQRFHACMQQIVETTEHPDSLADWKLRGLVMTLFAEALGEASVASTTKEPALDRVRLRQITTWFHRHHRTWPAPSALASQLDMSPDYFARLFRRATGLSPRSWMTRERIRLAALQLLESNRNVSEVAQAFGYKNVFFFSQQFKDIMGVSPSVYQRRRLAG